MRCRQKKTLLLYIIGKRLKDLHLYGVFVKDIVKAAEDCKNTEIDFLQCVSEALGNIFIIIGDVHKFIGDCFKFRSLKKKKIYYI